MKFYNPFKPHLVQFKNGGFAVRVLRFPLGWEYKECSPHSNTWWRSKAAADEFATFTSRLKAEELLLHINKQKEKRDFGTKL